MARRLARAGVLALCFLAAGWQQPRAQQVPNVNDVYVSGSSQAAFGPGDSGQTHASRPRGGSLRYDFRLEPFGAAADEVPKVSGSVVLDLDDRRRPPRLRAVIDGTAPDGKRVAGTLRFDGEEFRFDAVAGSLAIEPRDLGAYLTLPPVVLDGQLGESVRAHNLVFGANRAETGVTVELSPSEMGRMPPWRVLHRVDEPRREHLYLAVYADTWIPARIERINSGRGGVAGRVRLDIEEVEPGPAMPARGFRAGAR